MFVRVWEYDVAEGREAEFDRVYSSDGAWAQLFARSEGFLGTELFRSRGEARRYLTVDRFTTQDAFRRFMDQHEASYAELDRQCEALTVSEREVATAGEP